MIIDMGSRTANGSCTACSLDARASGQPGNWMSHQRIRQGSYYLFRQEIESAPEGGHTSSAAPGYERQRTKDPASLRSHGSAKPAGRALLIGGSTLSRALHATTLCITKHSQISPKFNEAERHWAFHKLCSFLNCHAADRPCYDAIVIENHYWSAKGKPSESWGRKVTGLRGIRSYDSGIAGPELRSFGGTP